MLEVKNIPAKWQELLAVIPLRAVIAGGSLRDLDHGFSPKDLDIFLECGDDEEAAGLNEMIGGKPIDQPELQWYPKSMQEVILISDYDQKKNKLDVEIDIPVQFIFCNWKINNILTRFDYGLCRIGFDGKEIFYTQEYETDKENKSMTLVRCKGESALAASVTRFARWRDKYPEHKWVLGCRLEMGQEPVDFTL